VTERRADLSLREGLRTTGSVRAFTDQPVTDEELHAVLDTARFAPSGTNLQGWHVIAIRDAAVRQSVMQLARIGMQDYMGFVNLGLRPFGADDTGQWPGMPPGTSLEQFRAQLLTNPLLDELSPAAVPLIICVDLRVIANVDADSHRTKVVAGGSIYPFVWSLLLAARTEGLGGVMTTFVSRQQEEARRLLHIPDAYGLASMVFLGHPVHQPTKLKRKPVETFTTIDRFDGAAFQDVASDGVSFEP
jgi:nitroreductase